jgi:hypothetical protein
MAQGRTGYGHSGHWLRPGAAVQAGSLRVFAADLPLRRAQDYRQAA